MKFNCFLFLSDGKREILVLTLKNDDKYPKMMKKKSKEIKIPENLEKVQNEGVLINDPAEAYSKPKTLHFFSSFTDENEATARINAQLKPEEHLKKAHELIIALYEKELQHLERPYYHITFVIKDGIPC